MSKRFLVADPCHVIDNDKWSDFLDKTEFAEAAEGFVIEGVGKILKCESSDGGDGCWKVGNGKEVGVDAGIVSIIELDEGVDVSKFNLDAVTKTLGVAEHWFNRVTGHENFQ